MKFKTGYFILKYLVKNHNFVWIKHPTLLPNNNYIFDYAVKKGVLIIYYNKSTSCKERMYLYTDTDCNNNMLSTLIHKNARLVSGTIAIFIENFNYTEIFQLVNILQILKRRKTRNVNYYTGALTIEI